MIQSAFIDFYKRHLTRTSTRRTFSLLLLSLVFALGAALPATAQGGEPGGEVLPLIADFEGGLPAGFGPYSDAFDGSGSATTVDVTTPQQDLPMVPGQAGNTVVAMTYDIVTTGSWGGGPGYGGLSHGFTMPQDWSNFDGFTFWFYGGNTGLTFQAEIFDNGTGAGDAERFDYNFVDDFNGWKLFEVPFADFGRATDFQPGGALDDGLTLTQMWGYAMVLAPGSGSFSLDKIAVYKAPINVANFDAGLPSGFGPYSDAFDGSGSATTVAASAEAIALPVVPAISANNAVSMTYDIVTSGSWGGGPGYGGLSHGFTTPQDWSDRDGLRFWFYGGNTGLTFQAEIFDNGTGPGDAERFDYNFVDDFSGWKLFEIPFADFGRATDFQPGDALDDGLTLTQMWGYAIVLAPGSGAFYLDQVGAYGAPTTLKVSFDSVGYSVDEGGTAVISVTLNSASGGTVDVSYATADDTATVGADYSTAAGTISFAPGTTLQTFGVNTIDDSTEESAETVLLTLSAPVGAELGGNSQTTLTIVDNEVRMPGNVGIVEDFENGLAAGTDANAIPIGWFTAQAAGSTVNFATTNTPPAPVPAADAANNVLQMDFDVTAWGVLIHGFENPAVDTWVSQDWSSYEGLGMWLYGQNSGTDFFIDILDNRGPGSTSDDAERFTVTFKDDFAGWTYLTFPFSDFTRKDVGNSAPNDGLTLTEMYGWAFGTLATNGPKSYFADDVGLTVRETVIEDFESGLAAGTDANNVPVGWFAAQDGGSTVSFTTTGSPPADVPGLATPNNTLQMDFDVAGFGVVIHNFENAAVDTWVSQDWSSYQGLAFWLYGQNSGTDLFVDVIDNRTVGSTGDDAERYTVAFKDDFSGWKYFEFPFANFTRKDIGNGAPNDGFTLSEVYGWAFGTLNTTGPKSYFVDQVTLYGTSGSDRPLEVSFNTNSYTVDEAAVGTITVKLSKVADVEVQVAYATSDRSNRTATEEDSATADRDYLATNGVLTFAPGVTEQSFNVEILDDTKDEVNETIILNLTDPVNADLGFVGEATLSIVDNDPTDASMVDDFELFPYQVDGLGDVTIGITELTSGTGTALPGQWLYEKVLDASYTSASGAPSIERGFPLDEDWSGSNGVSFWFYGSNSGESYAMELLDNQAADPGPGGWTLAWSDEFDGPAGSPADSDIWTYETGGWGWGNAEFQYYTDSTDNAAMDGNGNLVITTREIDPATTDLSCWYGPCTHTSARLITENKMEFTYGRVESRLRVPQGAGIWPAFWMLGADFREVGWPQTGEIDIMEFVGRLPQEIFGTIHGPGYAGGASFGGIYDLGEDVFNDYHTFAVEWQPGMITWDFDGIQYHQAVPANVDPNEWVFEHPFFMILNTAVGGNFGGALGPDLVFPQEYAVDYVRVYQAPDTAERFEAAFTDDFSGWKQITLPFDQFERSATQPAGAPDDGLTLSDLWGYGFKLPQNGSGSFMMDQVRLVNDVPPPPTCSDAITVTSTADGGDGSLRDAIANLCADGTITVDASLSGATVGLTSGPLALSRNATIDAAGAPGLAVSGGGSDRVFVIDAAVMATLKQLTIADGYGFDLAGGILNNGTLTLMESTVRNNNVTAEGNDFWKGGAGIYNGDGATLNLIKSTVRDNTTAVVDGGGIYGFFNSTLNIVDSTISGNVAGNVGGGLRTLGNGDIVNSTISGNTSTAWHGGAIFHTDGVMTLTNVTVVDNIAPDGTTGGLFVGTFSEGAPDMTLSNAIVAGNSGPQCLIGFFGAGVPELISGGYNIASDDTCNPTGTGDQPNTDPLLGPLADNGGATQTHVPQDDSPAVDAGGDGACPDADQRGVARPQGEACDVGAVEVEMTVVEVQPIIYVSSSSGGRVDGIRFSDADILAYDPNEDSWSLHFDGSDVGLKHNDLNGFVVLDDGSILMTLTKPRWIAGAGYVDNSDIVRFTPRSLGLRTAGRFELYMDGSDVGLTRSSEQIDALALAPDGRVVVSTKGSFWVRGLDGRDEDLIVLNATRLGKHTRGTWALYLAGSAVGLSNGNSEDVWGTWIDPANGDIYLTSLRDFSVDGLDGTAADIFVCMPEKLGSESSCEFRSYWRGVEHRFGNERINSFSIGGEEAVASAGTQAPLDTADLETDESEDVESSDGENVALPLIWK